MERSLGKAGGINCICSLTTAEFWHHLYDTTIVVGYCSGQYTVYCFPQIKPSYSETSLCRIYYIRRETIKVL